MLKLALSPYDLTTRSRSAALSLLLADAVCTLTPDDLPHPPEHAAEMHAASVDAFTREWSWTRELWDRGILTDDLAPAVAEQAALAWERLGGGALLAPARPARRDPAPSAPPLDAGRLILDIARQGVAAGADPAVRIAIEAGIMRAAAQTHVGVARDAGESVLDRLIERASQPMARLSLPIPEVLDEESVTDLRRFLAEPLAPLRAALEEVIAAIDAGAPPESARDVTDRRVAPMAEALIREAVLLETALGDRDSGVRAVSVRFLRAPSDILLRAAEAAVRGRDKASTPALVSEGNPVVLLSVKPLAFDAASI